MNIVLLPRLCITLRHNNVTIGGLGQLVLVVGAADVQVGGTVLLLKGYILQILDP